MQEKGNYFGRSVKNFNHSPPRLINDGLDANAFVIDRMLWTTQDKYASYCPFCKRVKYRYPERDVIKFNRSIFEGVPDIVKCHEYFGAGGQAQRLMLVSKVAR